MEAPLLLFILFLTILTVFKFSKRSTHVKLPPGPPKLPLIGNLHQLASRHTLPHCRLAELAKVYGPIMHLHLGEVPTVIISSPDMAREVMKTHDAVLCSRPRMMMPEVVFYKCSDIGLTPYGEYWRQVRKIATLELFTASRVQSFHPIREEEVMDLIKALAKEAGSVVNLSKKVFTLSFNIILRLSMNKKGEDGEEFRALAADLSKITSGFSFGDLYPSAKYINTITGMERRLKSLVKRLDSIMDPIIEEHISTKRQGNEVEDLVDVLLAYHKDNLHRSLNFSLTTDNIKAIVFELFGAASETSSTTIGWAFSELLKNPITMDKAQKEVRQVLQGKELVNVTSLDELKYLKLVIKETLRLHPPFPLLLPREAMEKCQIQGYEIPPKTRVFVNAWAIGRDAELWKDPERFHPERFEGSILDYKGNHFELIPFGAGRRVCPGMGLGMATIELTLAMLLYHFDWKLPNETNNEDLDMDEAFGIVGSRKNDLLVIPSAAPFSQFK